MHNTITIVALGPDDPGMLTLGALQTLREADRLILRTAVHGVSGFLRSEGVSFTALDDCYGASEDFDELCEAIVERLLCEAEEAPLVYAVPDPASDETVRQLMIHADPDRVRVLPGVSLSDAVHAAAVAHGFEAEHVHLLWASALEGKKALSEPQIICELNDRIMASDVKLWLQDIYEDDTEILFLSNAAAESPEGRIIHLYELDRQELYDHRTAIFVPETDVLTRSRASYADFVRIIEYLRSPEGCPWDRAQTHATLRRYMVEEACEAAEAMGGDDPDKIADELGDVLLQVVLNAQVGADHRTFTERDVTSAITRKMIARHEHVFGTAKADTPEATTRVWEQAKEKERGHQSLSEQLAELPEALPSLLKAQKMAKREATYSGKKLDAAVLVQHLSDLLGTEKGLDEAILGECLDTLCAIAEAQGLDAEAALRERLRRKVMDADS